jgi:virginiamycin B lyase
MTMPIASSPRPLCAAFAPLLPLISSGALEDDEAAPAREHVAGCAWCQQELARYVAVDEALRRQFGAASENLPLLPFDLDGDEDTVEDYAFTLEDTLEEAMTQGTNQQPPTTVSSSRWGERKRGPGPRATTITAIAAALILAVIAVTVYTQFAARRTPATPVATKTHSTVSKFAAPKANLNFPFQYNGYLDTPDKYGFTTTPDGSYWYSVSYSSSPAIGRVTPDGTNTEFPIPTDNTARRVFINGMAAASDGAIWVSGQEDRGIIPFSSFIWRMTPTGAFTTIPLRADLEAHKMIAGPDGAIWFSASEPSNAPLPAGFHEVGRNAYAIGRITTDGHITEYALPSHGGEGYIADLCVGADKAIWYTWIDSHFDSIAKGRIGRVSPMGQIQEFTVPHPAQSIASGTDGALWYDVSMTNTNGALENQNPLVAQKGSIGRITPSGAASELPVDPNVGIGQVSTGFDGTIWFTASGDQTGAFGRITPSGEVKKFSTGGDAEIMVIAAVPGALWLFDSRNNLWYYPLPR